MIVVVLVVFVVLVVLVVVVVLVAVCVLWLQWLQWLLWLLCWLRLWLWWCGRDINDDVFFHIAASVRLITVAEHLGVRFPASPPPGTPSTSRWTEAEKCRKLRRISNSYELNELSR